MLCSIAVANSHSKMVSTNSVLELCEMHSCHHNGEPQGAPKKKKRQKQDGVNDVMICTGKLPKSGPDHVTWAPKLGSAVATATM